MLKVIEVYRMGTAEISKKEMDVDAITTHVIIYTSETDAVEISGDLIKGIRSTEWESFYRYTLYIQRLIEIKVKNWYYYVNLLNYINYTFYKRNLCYMCNQYLSNHICLNCVTGEINE